MVVQESHMVGCMSVQIRFLNLDTTDMLGQVILCCKVFLVPCRMFSSISGLYLPDTSSVISYSDNKKCLLTLPNVSWKLKLPLIGNDYASVIARRQKF